jgi:nicotinate-nucleotide adenylyltransferase
MKVGLFGGTFNPIHFGHLRAALEVREGFGLDKVYLVPAAVPPHKAQGAVAAAADRLRMVTLAVEGAPGLDVSDVESRREGPTYTIDTVRHFRNELPAGTEIFLVVDGTPFARLTHGNPFEAYDPRSPDRYLPARHCQPLRGTRWAGPSGFHPIQDFA